MLASELEKLVFSLSAVEKKQFRMSCQKTNSEKDYLSLFDMLCAKKGESGVPIAAKFKNEHPNKSFENTAAYLFKLLTDQLVQLRIEQDDWYKQYHSLMKARICFERSLPIRGRKELQKAHQLATANQNHAVAYQAARMELTHLADTGFPNVSEQQLVDMQMKAKNTLQSTRLIHEHFSLYELLSHRLTKSGLGIDGKTDKKAHDLILSELSLTTRGSQHQFEPQKLHLLFQSFFFIHTGEYRSALKVFKDLNKLIEANESMWDYPPYDYLSALDGILDSLRSIRFHSEMPYYIAKAASLANRNYPDHFQNIATLTHQVYQLNMLVAAEKIAEALALVRDLHAALPAITDGIIQEKQLELLYFAALAYFIAKQWAQCRKLTRQFLNIGHLKQDPPAYRAGRLLHLLAAYETEDQDYLDYEIRSYKRAFQKQGKALKTEKLIFTMIAADPKRRGNNWKKVSLKKLTPRIEEIRNDKNETQLNKFYDYCGWVKNNHATNSPQE